MTLPSLPVVVIGAGPVGLAAAAHLVLRGETPLVLEAGTTVGASVRSWSHVRLFSPWRYVIDTASAALLEDTDWQQPDPEGYPTGHDLLDQYLLPLARHPRMAPHIRVESKVVSVTREGFDKMKTVGREEAPFLVTIATPNGETDVLAKAVIDASGTYSTPNPLGASGRWARGERELGDKVHYGIPEILGGERARFANKTVLVAGSGASAFNVLLDLIRLHDEAPDTNVVWVMRKPMKADVYGGGAQDQLPARGALGQRVRELVEQGAIEVVSNFKTTALERAGEQIVVRGADHALRPVDEVIVTTGFRPDLSMLAELRLGLDTAVESPTALAPLIDPNLHSCGTVRPHGAKELKHPEQNFYIIGSKSYGRAPTFLLLTGYEQARSVAAAIVGDWQAASEVQLVLPETGVCSGGGGSGSCEVLPSFAGKGTIALIGDLPGISCCGTSEAGCGC